MIQIINQSDYLWAISTTYKGSRSVPVEIALTPKTKPTSNLIDIASENFRKFGDGVKQEIANAIQAGIIQVNDLTDIHNVADTSMLPDSASGIVPGGDLPQLLQSANDYAMVYDAHDSSSIFHIGGAGSHQIAVALPSNWATLVTFLTDVKAKYNAHIVDGAMHNAADAVNGLTYTTPVLTNAAAAVAIKQLWGTYAQHKAWTDYTATLTPLTVFTY